MQEHDWPLPDPDAQAHSARLVDYIRQQIAAAGGSISFERYMDFALYAPGLGYYTAGSRKFGEAGDFVTAPEVSPLFARCLAGQCREVFAALGGGDILEPGAGSGVLAADLLAELERMDALPETYFILEVSADLRARQRETLEKKVPQLQERVTWLDAPPENLRGVILANEVLDALPVARFRVHETGFSEQAVTWNGGRFETAWQPASPHFSNELDALFATLPAPPAAPYVSERCRRLPAFVRALAGSLDAGLMLFIDYGYPRREYYLPERNAGTLMCHYRQRAHGDPFVYPGLQDITAYVDFTAVAEAGVEAGLDLHGFTSQAQFLLGSGLYDILPAVDPGDTVRSLKISQEVQKLTMPGEMGDRFKAMGLSRGIERLISGFSLKDISPAL
ncbi:MAG TPA: SAM-dependent methyltransferase [Gammaproteobacteria bacterium]